MNILKIIFNRFFCVSIVAFSITGCNPFVAGTPMDAKFKKAPLVRPLYDEYWVLIEDLTFTATRDSDNEKFEIIVPAGFVSDLASIPLGVGLIFDKAGQYSSAGILHDYLYWIQTCDRHTSDRLIKESLKATGSGYWTRNTIKVGVMLFGWWAWSSNSDLRNEDNEERYVPVNMRNFGPEKEWKKYKKLISEEPPWGWYSEGKVEKNEDDYCKIFED